MTSQLNKSKKLSQFSRNRSLSNKRQSHNTLFGGASFPYGDELPPPYTDTDTAPHYNTTHNQSRTDMLEDNKEKITELTKHFKDKLSEQNELGDAIISNNSMLEDMRKIINSKAKSLRPIIQQNLDLTEKNRILELEKKDIIKNNPFFNNNL